MSDDWVTLIAGLVGALFGAGGAIGTTALRNRHDRAERKSQREEDRRDRDAEVARERVARLREQGRSAAREALALTSPFFVLDTRVPWEPLTGEEMTDLRKVDDLAELIDSDDARQGIRAAVAAIAGAAVASLANARAKNAEESTVETALREQRSLELVRRILGSYLREEADVLVDLRHQTQAAKQEVANAHEYLMGQRPTP